MSSLLIDDSYDVSSNNQPAPQPSDGNQSRKQSVSMMQLAAALGVVQGHLSELELTITNSQMIKDKDGNETTFSQRLGDLNIEAIQKGVQDILDALQKAQDAQNHHSVLSKIMDAFGIAGAVVALLASLLLTGCVSLSVALPVILTIISSGMALGGKEDPIQMLTNKLAEHMPKALADVLVAVIIAVAVTGISIVGVSGVVKAAQTIAQVAARAAQTGEQAVAEGVGEEIELAVIRQAPEEIEPAANQVADQAANQVADQAAQFANIKSKLGLLLEQFSQMTMQTGTPFDIAQKLEENGHLAGAYILAGLLIVTCLAGCYAGGRLMLSNSPSTSSLLNNVNRARAYNATMLLDQFVKASQAGLGAAAFAMNVKAENFELAATNTKAQNDEFTSMLNTANSTGNQVSDTDLQIITNLNNAIIAISQNAGGYMQALADALDASSFVKG